MIATLQDRFLLDRVPNPDKLSAFERHQNGAISEVTAKKSNRIRLLVADDDETVRNLLDYHSQKHGFDPVLATCGDDVEKLADEDLDVALLDLRMPNGDGMHCLQFLAKAFPDIPAVVLSSADEVQDAVAAMKAGAVDYLTKPFDLEEVFAVLRHAIEHGRLKKENRELREAVGVSRPASGFIGDSEATREILGQMERVAAIDSTVLLLGESGVGKGLAARTIHYGGPRADKPFVTVSCPALPRELLESELFGHEKGSFTGALQKRIGKVEMAEGGTLFLDEIGDLPLELQPKLLNVLQDREFFRVGGNQPLNANVRIVAATNVDLKEQVKRREFREDLFYRLNVIPLEIPPLRERPEDTETLAKHFLDKISAARGIKLKLDKEALIAVRGYDWPGNVRQLENALERATAFCSEGLITPEELPVEVTGRGTPGENETLKATNLAGIPLREVEKAALMQTLHACGGNKAATARRLEITEKSVYNKLKRYGLL
jgi:two-component system response regulator HydG